VLAEFRLGFFYLRAAPAFEILGASAVNRFEGRFTAETQRSQRLRGEKHILNANNLQGSTYPFLFG